VSQISLWSEEGEPGLTYLREKRHISDDVIKKFQIGYCPQGTPPISDIYLGGRIIMPCFDAHGNIVAFSTRNPWVEKRYQHWHESFDKTSYLYGLHVSKKSIRHSDKAIIVEGQFDVACLHSNGLSMTVGLFGTTFSIMHVALLSRYCSEIYVLFDPQQREGDVSGQEGTARAMKLYYDYCLNTYGIYFIPIVLPGSLDPDDFVYQHGKDELTHILNKRRNEVING